MPKTTVETRAVHVNQDLDCEMEHELRMWDMVPVLWAMSKILLGEDRVKTMWVCEILFDVKPCEPRRDKQCQYVPQQDPNKSETEH